MSFSSSVKVLRKLQYPGICRSEQTSILCRLFSWTRVHGAMSIIVRNPRCLKWMVLICVILPPCLREDIFYWRWKCEFRFDYSKFWHDTVDFLYVEHQYLSLSEKLLWMSQILKWLSSFSRYIIKILYMFSSIT